MTREELANEVQRAAGFSGDEMALTLHQAHAILDAILPQVTTVEELEALPSKSLLFGTGGGQAEPVLWQPSWQDPQEILEMFGPLTVVWSPS